MGYAAGWNHDSCPRRIESVWKGGFVSGGLININQSYLITGKYESLKNENIIFE